MMEYVSRGERRLLGLHEAVDPDHRLLAALDCLEPRRIELDQLLLHVAGLDGRHRPAHVVDAAQFLLGLALERLDLARNLRRTVENVAVLEEVGLKGEDLLEAERPLLVPRPRQAERLVPGGQLYGARACVFRQRHRQHFDQDASDVVLGLLLGEAERIHLHAVAEQSVFRIGDAVAFAGDLVPQLGESAHLAQLGDEAQSCIDEERDAPDRITEFFRRNVLLHPVEDGDGGGEREGEFLYRRGTGFLQMVGADVHRVPARHLLGREQDDVLGETQRRGGRKHMGAAREIFLDDVVLGGALQTIA